MYNVYFDSGTSNTRAYLLNNYQVIDEVKRNIGSKDSSIAGSNEILVRALKELYEALLKNNHVEDNQILDIYGSGMLTSPFGITEVPHLSTPLSLEKLCQGIFTYFEPNFFKRDIHLIRGVKSIGDNFSADLGNICSVNNMRGEEIEIFGMLSDTFDQLKFGSIAAFFPGSHTHIAFIKNVEIYDILSTFSGELFYSVTKDTILSNSVACDTDEFDKDGVLLGFKHLKEYGFNRALYMVHTTKIFNACDNFKRKSYLEGVITGGVIVAFENLMKSKRREIDAILIGGNSNSSKIYEVLLKESQPEIRVETIISSGKQSFAVKGFVEILKRGGVLCQKRS